MTSNLQRCINKQPNLKEESTMAGPRNRDEHPRPGGGAGGESPLTRASRSHDVNVVQTMEKRHAAEMDKLRVQLERAKEEAKEKKPMEFVRKTQIVDGVTVPRGIMSVLAGSLAYGAVLSALPPVGIAAIAVSILAGCATTFVGMKGEKHILTPYSGYREKCAEDILAEEST